MKLFSRMSATIMGSVDNAVSRVENHDAVIEAGIKKIRKSAANARVRLARVQKDGQRLHKQLQELSRNEIDWQRRAKQVGTKDEQRALECLRRKAICRQKITYINQSLEEHHALEEKLRGELIRIESKLKEISMQRNKMKSRQSVAEATRILGAVNGDDGSNIEDTFDRWEAAITDTEIFNDDAWEINIADEFVYQFESAEDEAALKSELVDLLANTAENDHEAE